MRLRTVPFGEPAEVHWGSDIASLDFSSQGLSVRIAREVSIDRVVKGVDVSFVDASAFRYLDELDLARYWNSEGFVRGYPILEVLAGGWCDEEATLQQYKNSRREWLIVTGNGCISVFASTNPTVREVEWKGDA